MKSFAFACLLAASAVSVSLSAEAETELGAEFMNFGLGGGGKKSGGGGFDVNELIRKARTKINNKGSVSDEEEEEALEYEFEGITEKVEDPNDAFAIKKLDFKGDTTSEDEAIDEDEAEALEDVKDQISKGFDNVQQ